MLINILAITGISEPKTKEQLHFSGAGAKMYVTF
jgi:hypothetical protein